MLLSFEVEPSVAQVISVGFPIVVPIVHEAPSPAPSAGGVELSYPAAVAILDLLGPLVRSTPPKLRRLVVCRQNIAADADSPLHKRVLRGLLLIFAESLDAGHGGQSNDDGAQNEK